MALNAPAADALDKANSHERAGNPAGALHWLRIAAQQAHRDASLHLRVAQAAMRMGQPALALASMDNAVRLAPGDTALRFQYACLLAHEGMHAAALEHFHASVPSQPHNPHAWRLLGVTLQRLGRHAEALLPLRRARELAPDNERVLETLAESEFHAGYPDDALPLLQALRELRPRDPLIALRLAETFNRLGQHQQAFDLLTSMARTAEQPGDLLVALAQTAEDRGDRDAARDAYLAALQARPDWAFPLSGLLGLDRAKADDATVDRAIVMLRDTTLPDADRALLGYELGKVFDGRKRYADAMNAWHEANSARRRLIGPANLEGTRHQIEVMIRTMTRERLEQRRRRWGGNPDPRPLFIVGMPRSGTTLTEQILAAHPSGFGCGELPDIGLIVRNLPLSAGPGASWPSSIDQIDDTALRDAADRYLRAATRGAPADALRLIDKAPLNFNELGLIALLFPQARVIWCRRDPRDIAVSVYGENFALDERLANDLGDIGHYINFQTRLMRHWQATLSLPVLELVYEELATCPEPQARRIIDFAGLPWHPDCLEFHKNERGVQTPSRWQVKQPIYTRSIGRWKHYQEHLAPLLHVLEPDTYPVWSAADAAPATHDQATTPSA